jgi:hypothetical protein
MFVEKIGEKTYLHSQRYVHRCCKYQRQRIPQAGLLTSLLPSFLAFPIKNQWPDHNPLRNVVQVTVVGAVSDFHRIPYYLFALKAAKST